MLLRAVRRNYTVVHKLGESQQERRCYRSGEDRRLHAKICRRRRCKDIAAIRVLQKRTTVPGKAVRVMEVQSGAKHTPVCQN